LRHAQKAIVADEAGDDATTSFNMTETSVFSDFQPLPQVFQLFHQSLIHRYFLLLALVRLFDKIEDENGPHSAQAALSFQRRRCRRGDLVESNFLRVPWAHHRFPW